MYIIIIIIITLSVLSPFSHRPDWLTGRKTPIYITLFLSVPSPCRYRHLVTSDHPSFTLHPVSTFTLSVPLPCQYLHPVSTLTLLVPYPVSTFTLSVPPPCQYLTLSVSRFHLSGPDQLPPFLRLVSAMRLTVQSRE